MSNFSLEKIKSNLRSQKITREEAQDTLIAILDKSESVKLRIQTIKLIEELGLKSSNIYIILENLMISDENPLIRSKAIDLIVKMYIDRGYSALNYVIENDKSILVNKKLSSLLAQFNKNFEISLYRQLLKKLEKVYDVLSQEALFLLDLDFLKKDRYEIGIYKPPSIHKHITNLELAGWKLDKLPESIGNLSMLKHLNLWNNNLKNLPNSFENLQSLESLYLDWNDFEEIPDVNWKKLISLQKVSITNNIKIKEINQLFYELIKQNLSQKYVIEGVNSREAPILALLEVLTGQKITKYYSDQQINKLYACNYKINENGHIIGIFLYGYHSFQINFIPDNVKLLKSLEVLILREQSIKEIPEWIDNLDSLKKLDLVDNNITKIPESFRLLESLEYLDLRGNSINKTPDYLIKKNIEIWL